MNKYSPEECGPGMLDLLEEWLEGDLAGEAQERFEAHLAACPVCQEEARKAERLATALRSFPRPTCPERVVDRVLAQIGESPRPEKVVPLRPSVWLRSALPAALAASIALVWWWSAPPVKTKPLPPTYSAEEIRVAERQVEATLAYVGYVGEKSARLVGRDLVRKGFVEPVRKTATALSELDVFDFKTRIKEN